MISLNELRSNSNWWRRIAFCFCLSWNFKKVIDSNTTSKSRTLLGGGCDGQIMRKMLTQSVASLWRLVSKWNMTGAFCWWTECNSAVPTDWCDWQGLNWMSTWILERSCGAGWRLRSRSRDETTNFRFDACAREPRQTQLRTPWMWWSVCAQCSWIVACTALKFKFPPSTIHCWQQVDFAHFKLGVKHSLRARMPHQLLRINWRLEWIELG